MRDVIMDDIVGEKQPDKRCGTCKLCHNKSCASPKQSMRKTEEYHGTDCASWRPKEKPVEEWHGFRKGERVRHKECGDGSVTGGDKSFIWAQFDKFPENSGVLPESLTRLPVEHKFKVRDNILAVGEHRRGCRGRIIELGGNKEALVWWDERRWKGTNWRYSFQYLKDLEPA